MAFKIKYHKHSLKGGSGGKFDWQTEKKRSLTGKWGAKSRG